MDMAHGAKVWNRADVLDLPDDGNRYELVDGELLVTPSPSAPHQRAITELFRLLDPYVRAHGLGHVSFSPADLDLRAGQLVQPDLFVGGAPGGPPPLEWDEFGVPILVVEVLSPSTARYDRITKRRRYQRSGVDRYWIVDLEARLVEVWTPAGEQPAVVDDRLVWQPDPAVPALAIDVPAYFRGVWGS
jgi:Uma2 family endonuclease